MIMMREQIGHGASIVGKLRRETKPAMVQAAPGKWVPADAKRLPPDKAIASWTQNADGTYSLLPDNLRLVRLDVRVARLLGFAGQWHTLYRLARMGAIELIRVAPRVHLLNLDSYYNWLRRCAEDPDIWDPEGECAKEYRKAKLG